MKLKFKDAILNIFKENPNTFFISEQVYSILKTKINNNKISLYKQKEDKISLVTIKKHICTLKKELIILEYCDRWNRLKFYYSISKRYDANKYIYKYKLDIK